MEFSASVLLSLIRNSSADSVVRARTSTVHSVHLLRNDSLAAPTSHLRRLCVSYSVTRLPQLLDYPRKGVPLPRVPPSGLNKVGFAGTPSGLNQA